MTALWPLAACEAPAAPDEPPSAGSERTSPTTGSSPGVSSGAATSTTVTSTTVATTTSTSVPERVAPLVTIPPDRALRVLIIGDSVGASLAGPDARERVEIAGSGVVDVENVSGPACPVIFDGDWWFSDGSTLLNPTCDRPDRYDDELAEFDPDIVLSVFGWPGVGGGQRFADGSVAAPCEPRFDQAWADGYRGLVERITPQARVIVTTVAPISMDPRRPESGCLNDVVRGLPAEVFDLQEWLCPGLDCSVRSELRTDGVHFADDPQLRRAALAAILDELVAPAR